MLGLEKSKLFDSLSERELQLLKENAVIREFPARQAIFEEGDEGDGIYVVLSGLVQISAVINDGDRRVLSTVGPGDFFGEMAVLDQEPRSGTATCTEPCTLAFIRREELIRMIERSPRLAISLVREFSLRMRDFNRQYIREVLQAERLTLVGRFARTIVHDLKNPLNIIGLAAELADMPGASDEIRKSASSRIRKQVERVSNMINELLEFTRGSQNPVFLGATEFAPYVRKIAEDLGAEAADKRVTITVEPPPEVTILMDSKRVLHVFSNLVHNAVDAMPDGGDITFRFQLTPDELIIEVRDTGPGIAPEATPRLFEAFATFGKAKGTGLGLSICKRIVEDHGGWIKAGNVPGGGAIFSFSLPLAK